MWRSMFRFINAWLQAVFRYITFWLPAAAADDPDAAALQAAVAAGDSDAAVALPQAAMDFPVTVSLGPLHRQLHSFRATKNNLPEGVSEDEIRRLEEDLEALFTELKIVSEADDPSFTARCWMKEARELRYDAEDFFNEVPRPCAGAGRSALLAVILWIPSKLKRQRQVAEAFLDLRTRVKNASRRRKVSSLVQQPSSLNLGKPMSAAPTANRATNLLALSLRSLWTSLSTCWLLTVKMQSNKFRWYLSLDLQVLAKQHLPETSIVTLEGNSSAGLSCGCREIQI